MVRLLHRLLWNEGALPLKNRIYIVQLYDYPTRGYKMEALFVKQIILIKKRCCYPALGCRMESLPLFVTKVDRRTVSQVQLRFC